MGTENNTAYAILGLLHHEPLSGYDIKKRVEVSIGRFWDLGYGQIYPTLKKLAAEGLVTLRTEKGDGRPDRKVYALTNRGREELRRWLAEPAAREYVRYEVLLKLFFGSLVEPERSARTIEEFRARYAGEVEVMEAFAAELRRILPQSPDHLYYLLTVLFGLKVHQAYLAWADEALALLRGSDGSVKE